MNKKVNGTITNGNGTFTSEIRLPTEPLPKPVCNTIKQAPEPKFEEIQHLHSNKPLRFNRPHKLP